MYVHLIGLLVFLKNIFSITESFQIISDDKVLFAHKIVVVEAYVILGGRIQFVFVAIQMIRLQRVKILPLDASMISTTGLVWQQIPQFLYLQIIQLL